MLNRLSFEQLRQQHKQVREHLQDAQNLRLHRAISWLKAADECPHEDGRFIFLWVSFNSVYATELSGYYDSETKQFTRYLTRIVVADADKQIYGVLWQQYAGAIRVLLDNRYVFQPYWDWANAPEFERNGMDWKARFERAKTSSHKALANNDVIGVLSVVFNRLYTLRNQIIHGGATFSSRVNRDQLSDACHILAELMPIVLDIMMRKDSQPWGDAIYPVISV